MITKTKKSHSYNQNQLKVICDSLCDKIEELLPVLGVDELKMNGKMIVGKCPIHDGDNVSAFNLYPYGDTYKGNWKCRTHGCEKIFKASIIGFIRGIISSKKYHWKNDGDKTASFNETMDFIQSFLNTNIGDIKINTKELEKKKFSLIVNNVTNGNKEKTNGEKISRNQVRKLLKIPGQYFLDRGFDPKILDKYDVGLCDNDGKEMFNRVVAPIYDNDYKFLVGCTGRSVFEKCNECKYFHDPQDNCPNEMERWKYSKWKHNLDFKSQNYLYNFWFAKKYILDSSCVILVESPGNVWKLEEAGIHNSVAMFGSSLSDRQKIILDGSGAMTIIILTDNDEAGEKAAKQIKEKCQNTYKVYFPKISKPDVAEMTIDEINNEIKSFIERVA